MSSTLRITDIQLFNTLKKKLGEQEAEELVGFVKASVNAEVNDQVPNIATKDFVEAKISEAKFQIILWAFVFWVTQLGAVFAFLKFFIR